MRQIILSDINFHTFNLTILGLRLHSDANHGATAGSAMFSPAFQDKLSCEIASFKHCKASRHAFDLSPPGLSLVQIADLETTYGSKTQHANSRIDVYQ